MDKDFSKHIGYYVQEIARKTTIILNHEFERVGITYSQFRVLNCLWKKGGLTQKEILEIICVKPSTLTGIIDILVKKDLVIRKADEVDRRVKRIFLTDKGKGLKQASWQIIMELESRSTKKLSQEEKALMIKWLKCIDKNL